jgi:hypothetical protein
MRLAVVGAGSPLSCKAIRILKSRRTVVHSGFPGNRLPTVGAGYDFGGLAGIKLRLLQALRVVQPKARQNSDSSITLMCSICNALVKSA